MNTNASADDFDADMDAHRVDRLRALGAQLRETLEAGLDKARDCLERPLPLAYMLAAQKKDPLDARSLEFESLIGAYLGVVVQAWIEPYLALHAALTQKGHAAADSAFLLGGDSYVWSCADHEVVEEADPKMAAFLEELGHTYAPSTHKVKAFALRTQSRNYFVLLILTHGRWRLHIRRFWDNLQEVRASKGYYLLQEFGDRQDLTLEDVVKLAQRAAEAYGDDLPGVAYPKRPLLATFLGGNLLAGDRRAGLGLRYGDSRDLGYVVSFDNDRTEPRVAHGPDCPYGELAHAAYVAASAYDQLVLGAA